jgi:hypothetical protein
MVLADSRPFFSAEEDSFRFMGKGFGIYGRKKEAMRQALFEASLFALSSFHRCPTFVIRNFVLDPIETAVLSDVIDHSENARNLKGILRC